MVPKYWVRAVSVMRTGKRQSIERVRRAGPGAARHRRNGSCRLIVGEHATCLGMHYLRIMYATFRDVAGAGVERFNNVARCGAIGLVVHLADPCRRGRLVRFSNPSTSKPRMHAEVTSAQRMSYPTGVAHHVVA